MTKITKKIVKNPRQRTLLEVLASDREERQSSEPGHLCVSARLKAVVKEAIKAAPKSRETIAAEMSTATAQEITVHMINMWLSDSHPHRIPAEFLPSLAKATGSTEPLRVLAEAAGLYTMPGEEAIRAEVRSLREQEQKIVTERKRREAFLKELAR